MKAFIQLLFVLMFLCMCLNVYAQEVIIPFQSVWSYHDEEFEPLQQGGENWTSLSYNDDSWVTGTAQLGYGDDDESTEVNEEAYTLYVRHNFQVQNDAGSQLLNLELLYDDGAVVYLNGTEIWRVNMPSGEVGYDTFASSSSSDNQVESITVTGQLNEGDNILAVEIHQKSSSSSDLSFDFQLSTSQVEIERGPYLQKVSPSSIVLKWRTSHPDSCTIDYGLSVTNLDQSVSSVNNAEIDHEFEIQGLAANTTYFYKISGSRNVLIDTSSQLYFKTSPEAGSRQSTSFWLLGDCGTANDDQRAVRDAFYDFYDNNHLDGIIFLGDNAYEDGTDEEYQYALFEDMYEGRLKNTVSWSCLGNHDGISADSESQTGPYFDIFTLPKSGESGGVASGTEAYYSFDYGNVHFIALDSYESDRSVGNTMYNWCENDLQNTAAEWIIAFWHHPPYSSGSKDSDSDTELVEMREHFLPLLESYGVDLVVTGHSHTYQRTYLLNGHYGKSTSFNCKEHTIGPNGNGDGKIGGDGAYKKVIEGAEADKGAVYVVTGSSGKQTNSSFDHPAMYFAIDQLGSCLLEIDSSRLDIKFVRETGIIDDYFTIIKEDLPCIDWDGDGHCMDTDPDDSNACIPDPNSTMCFTPDTLMVDDFEDGYGNWKDGGSDCTRKSSNAYSGNYSVRLRDDSGSGSSLISKHFDFRDFSEVLISFTFVAEDMEDGEKFLLELSVDGGDSYSVYQSWEEGKDFENEVRYFEEVVICDNYFTDDNRFRFRCDASSNADYVFLDDIVISKIGFCIEGAVCNDGDPCTTSSILDDSCNCIGGVFTDNDEDGICIGEDIDDDDPCVPNENNLACNPCVTVISDDFESGFGNWNDGGEDCFHSEDYAQSGTHSILLIDNAGEKSSMFTNDIDFSVFETATISFSFYTYDMEDTEDFFLEISTDGGSEYELVRDWVKSIDFENESWYFESVSIDNIEFTEATRFRFRCDAHSNQDFVYIDDVEITGCIGNPSTIGTGSTESSAEESLTSQTDEEQSQQGIVVFPNPAIGELEVHIDVGLEDEPGNIFLYNAHGVLMQQKKMLNGEKEFYTFDVSHYPSGLYSIFLKRPGKRFVVKKLVILND